MERIAHEKRGAVLVWCSKRIGTWDGVRAQVSHSRGRIGLSFDTPGGRLLRLVRALERTAEGARVVVAGAQGRGVETLDIVWKDAGKPAEPPGDLLDLVRSWLRQHRPGAGILSCSRCSDRAHSLSRFFLRVHARFRQRDCLVLAAPGEPNKDRTPELLTQALIWARVLAKGGRMRSTPTAVLLAPWKQSAELYNRVRCIDKSRVAIELWEYKPCGGDWRLRKAPPPPLPVEHRDYRWPVMGPFRWSRMLADVMDLAPADIRRHPRFCEFDSLRLRGLEFARAEGSARDRVTFGIGPGRAELTARNFDQLRELVEGILYYRRPESPNPHHQYYQLQSERWLESLMLDDMNRLFPELAPESVYSQIPVYLGSAQGRVDILGADADGTLLIMELKVSEDAGLPLQALDYWGRVIRHNFSGDFNRRGYFSEVRLNRQRPRVYLVSPVFSFHDTTESILDFVSSEIEVWKISINTDWRCGVKILDRTHVKRGSRTGLR